MPTPAASTRRTEGVRTQGRSARVVDAVLRETAAELGRVGYSALRIEDVARRSGVNKTTVYRRWPTKQDLVAAAVGALHLHEPVPDTGRFRDDLLELARQLVRKLRNPLSRGLVRTIQLERADPEVDVLARRLRSARLKEQLVVCERARARGELPADADGRLVLEVLTSTVVSRLTRTGDPVDEPFLQALVTLVVRGAQP